MMQRSHRSQQHPQQQQHVDLNGTSSTTSNGVNGHHSAGGTSKKPRRYNNYTVKSSFVTLLLVVCYCFTISYKFFNVSNNATFMELDSENQQQIQQQQQRMARTTRTPTHNEAAETAIAAATTTVINEAAAQAKMTANNKGQQEILVKSVVVDSEKREDQEIVSSKKSRSSKNIRSVEDSLLRIPKEHYESMTYEQRGQELLNDIRHYYYYTEDDIALQNVKEVRDVITYCREVVIKSKEYNSYCFDVLSEQYVLNALQNHPWNINNNNNNNENKTTTTTTTVTNTRTNEDNKNTMMIHIVSTPLIALVGLGCKGAQMKLCLKRNMAKPYLHKGETTKRSVFDRPFTALTNHPRFIQQDNGRYHVLSSIQYYLFASHPRTPHLHQQLNKWYPKIQNVTLAHHYDSIAIHSIYQNENLLVENNIKTEDELHDYIPLFQKRSPVVQYLFVLGIGIDLSIPLQIPTIDRYKRSREEEKNLVVSTTTTSKSSSSNNSVDSYFIFYRTRTRPSSFNSTVYRLAPLTMINAKDYPIFNETYSSIGHDLPYDTWLEHMMKSQFCLAIRGDSPHTHALIRTIRAGCVPVVISDYYPAFGAPFSSIIAMEEYSIMIPEAEFLANPAQSLLSLRNIPLEILEKKIQGVQYVQRILFPDHPQTLFVPAYLKQVMYANERKAWP